MFLRHQLIISRLVWHPLLFTVPHKKTLFHFEYLTLQKIVSNSSKQALLEVKKYIFSIKRLLTLRKRQND